jgi:hypothetical protein
MDKLIKRINFFLNMTALSGASGSRMHLTRGELMLLIRHYRAGIVLQRALHDLLDEVQEPDKSLWTPSTATCEKARVALAEWQEAGIL